MKTLPSTGWIPSLHQKSVTWDYFRKIRFFLHPVNSKFYICVLKKWKKKKVKRWNLLWNILRCGDLWPFTVKLILSKFDANWLSLAYLGLMPDVNQWDVFLTLTFGELFPVKGSFQQKHQLVKPSGGELLLLETLNLRDKLHCHRAKSTAVYFCFLRSSTCSGRLESSAASEEHDAFIQSASRHIWSSDGPGGNWTFNLLCVSASPSASVRLGEKKRVSWWWKYSFCKRMWNIGFGDCGKCNSGRRPKRAAVPRAGTESRLCRCLEGGGGL